MIDLSVEDVAAFQHLCRVGIDGDLPPAIAERLSRMFAEALRSRRDVVEERIQTLLGHGDLEDK